MRNQHARHQYGSLAVGTHTRERATGCRAPYRSSSVQPTHGEAVFQNQSATQKANARHYLRSHTRGIAATCRHRIGQHRKCGCAYCNENVCAQSGIALAVLSLHSNQCTHKKSTSYSCKKFSKENHNYLFFGKVTVFSCFIILEMY